MFRTVPRNICAFVALGAPVLFVSSFCVSASQYNVEAALGVDSNPAQARHAKEMAFAQYTFSARQDIPLNRDAITLTLDGNYRDLEGDNDNQRLQLGAHWSYPLKSGRSTVQWFLSAGLYRDQLVAADERNDAFVGMDFTHTLSPRIDLNLAAQLGWLNYRNRSQPWAGRPGGGTFRQAKGGGPGGNPGTGISPTRRVDLQVDLAVISTWYFSPEFDISLQADYQGLDSRVAQENYRQIGTGIDTRWLPVPQWQTQFGLAWYQRSYDGTGKAGKRHDEQLSVEGSLSHFIGDMEIYIRAAFTNNHSNLQRMSFKQTITECGIGWAF